MLYPIELRAGSRGGRIRTCIPLVPNQTRYQVAPRLDGFVLSCTRNAATALAHANVRTFGSAAAVTSIARDRGRRTFAGRSARASPRLRCAFWVPTLRPERYCRGGQKWTQKRKRTARQRAHAHGERQTSAELELERRPVDVACRRHIVRLRDKLCTPAQRRRQAFVVDFFASTFSPHECTTRSGRPAPTNARRSHGRTARTRATPGASSSEAGRRQPHCQHLAPSRDQEGSFIDSLEQPIEDQPLDALLLAHAQSPSVAQCGSSPVEPLAPSRLRW